MLSNGGLAIEEINSRAKHSAQLEWKRWRVNEPHRLFGAFLPLTNLQAIVNGPAALLTHSVQMQNLLLDVLIPFNFLRPFCSLPHF